MRNLLVSLLLASCTLPVFAGGMQLASEMTQAKIPHRFEHLSGEPLWSSEVKPVDRKLQAYERVPGIAAPETQVANTSSKRVNIVMNPINGNAGQIVVSAAPPVDAASGRMKIATEVCSARYKSYRAEDNTYQPFDGGPRRICTLGTETVAQSVTPPASIVTEPVDERSRWCAQQYSSYRAEDNTYQPYSGGRKQCVLRGVQSASNETKSSPSLSIASF